MIFNKSFVKKKKVRVKEKSNAEKPGWKKKMVSLWIQEIRGVYLWLCMAFAARVLIRFLYDLAAYRDNNTMPEYFWHYTAGSSREMTGIKLELLKISSIVSSWALSLMPSKVLTLQAPGFIFANPILLLWIRDKTQMIPNIPTRASDYVLGRIRLWEFLSLLPVHVLVTFLLSMSLRRVLANDMIEIALGTIQYAEGGNPWIVDFFSEMLITAAYTVALQVLPVLFQLNRVPRWCVVWLFFPIFNFSVDSKGMGSAFCPNILLTFGLMGYGAPEMRIMSSMLGGMIGGKIMQTYFPDDKPVSADLAVF
ncbi:unnamed protein product [Cylindrotheca closterium]|uniref:Uncharacterized protein n=1 Tax=Cylindrotheca closterium TaxID=2856 RepID=A0AAD2FL02_9STRA|nr:unnamed protein product [Cylindrotheca closterium]